jgi:hypothetical protein
MNTMGLKRSRGRPREVVLDPKALLDDIVKVLDKFPNPSERAIVRRLQSSWAARTLETRYKDISYRTLRRNVSEILEIARSIRMR